MRIKQAGTDLFHLVQKRMYGTSIEALKLGTTGQHGCSGTLRLPSCNHAPLQRGYPQQYRAGQSLL
jgi:hypothetical protein